MMASASGEVFANKKMHYRYRDRYQIEINFCDLLRSARLKRIDAYLFIIVLAYFVLAFLRWYSEEHG